MNWWWWCCWWRGHPLTPSGVCRFCGAFRSRCAGPAAPPGRWNGADARWGPAPSAPAPRRPASDSAPQETPRENRTERWRTTTKKCYWHDKLQYFRNFKWNIFAFFQLKVKKKKLEYRRGFWFNWKNDSAKLTLSFMISVPCMLRGLFGSGRGPETATVLNSICSNALLKSPQE